MIGIGASPGIAIGTTFVKRNPDIEIKKKKIIHADEEIIRLKDALLKSKEEIRLILKKAADEIGNEEAKVFEAHLMILDDPEMYGQIENKIRGAKVSTEEALEEVSKTYIGLFENMDNLYMRERAADIKDVTKRVLRNLTGADTVSLADIKGQVIIVADELTPSDTAQMDKTRVIGIITELGGKTSHSSIMARTLEIPAVVGAGKEIEHIKSGDTVIIDGDKGTVILNPEEALIKKYTAKKEACQQLKKKLKSFIGKDTITKDGIKVELAANIGTPEDVDGVLKNDGEGIGLYRTEFLYMDRDTFPTEEEQFIAYKSVLERMGGKPVVVRTLDIGGDKILPYLALPEEMNPFLGLRAIRLCLNNKEIFKTQLRALLRASIYGNLKIMFPMISSVEELREAKKILEKVRQELKNEGIRYSFKIEIGMMIEVPAAAILSEIFAKEVDFFSIGTNDLLQYTVAVDRGNKEIANLYNPFHPALLRLIKNVIENGHKEGIWVGMCGEIAGDPRLIPVLVGMGLDEFSMSPISILNTRFIISNLIKKELEKKSQEIINCSTAEEVCEVLDSICVK